MSLLLDATSIDDQFIAALDTAGISYHSRAEAINAGHLVCTKLAAGETPQQVAQDLISSSNLDPYHGGFVTGAAIAAYCRQYEGRF